MVVRVYNSLAVLCYTCIMQMLLYLVLSDVQNLNGKDTCVCVFSHIFKCCSAMMLELKGLVLQDLLGVQRPTEKI